MKITVLTESTRKNGIYKRSEIKEKTGLSETEIAH